MSGNRDTNIQFLLGTTCNADLIQSMLPNLF